MSCMKCGREIGTEQVFCEQCLAEMEKYPVKPNTVVLLPNRSALHSVKKTHQRRISPEEHVLVLRRKCRRLIAALVITVMMAIGLSALVGFAVYESDLQRFMGQNYSTSETAASRTGTAR